jgi:aminoglycoside phosphotransferase (APT) family kinase protein
MARPSRPSHAFRLETKSVSSKAPIVILDQAIETHAALRAWSRLGGPREKPVKVEVWRELPTHQPASVYRLVFAGGTPAVFAKHSDRRFGAVERACYEAVLPRMGLPSPAWHGSLQDEDGSWWMFIEDAGREWYSITDAAHRRLAGRWLGHLHREGAGVAAARTLPPAGPERYLGHLRAARGRIECNYRNPGLTMGDREVLNLSLVLQDAVESRWERIERACEGPPATLVHGDFQPKNIRVVAGAPEARVLVLDWEMAGWGCPAVDLAAPCAADVTSHVDLAAYAAEVCAEWRGVDMEAIHRLAAVGLVFRRLAAMDWASESLHFEQPNVLSDPVESLRFLNRSLSRGLATAEEWLG